jgi:hypothetical protein
MENAGDAMYYIWFVVFIAVLVVIFVAKLKFNDMFSRRQDRRKLLSYSKAKLMSSNDGKTRKLRIKRIKDILK